VAKKGHTEEQILRALRQAEGGTRVADICREHGVSEATFYIWKKKYSGLGLSELRELRQLREENSKLKHLVADLSLDRQPTLVPNFQIFAKFDARSKRRDRFSRDSPVVRRQNLLDKLATELREDLVHLG